MINTQKVSTVDWKWERACQRKVEDLTALLDTTHDENTIRFIHRQIKNWTRLSKGE